jgi:hypothetical protein
LTSRCQSSARPSAWRLKLPGPSFSQRMMPHGRAAGVARQPGLERDRPGARARRAPPRAVVALGVEWLVDETVGRVGAHAHRCGRPRRSERGLPARASAAQSSARATLDRVRRRRTADMGGIRSCIGCSDRAPERRSAGQPGAAASGRARASSGPASPAEGQARPVPQSPQRPPTGRGPDP